MKVTGTPHTEGSVIHRTYLSGKPVVAVARDRSLHGWLYYCPLCIDPGWLSGGFRSWRAAYDAADAHLTEHLMEDAEMGL